MFKFFVPILFSVSTFSLIGSADPIADGSFNSFKAAWLYSTNTPCPTLCTAAGAKAESEVFSAPSVGNKYTSVCKALATTSGPYAGNGFLYGNNFDSPNFAPFCMISTLSGQVLRQSKFYCLCAY